MIIPIFKEFNEPNTIKIKFLELKFNSKFAGIIGSDILNSLAAKIDYKNRVIQTRSTQINFFLNDDEKSYLEKSMFHVNEPSTTLEKSFNPVFKLSENIANNESHKLKYAISSFKDLFYKEGDNLTFTSKVKHRIQTKNSAPIYTKTYRYPEIHRNEVDRQIREMLNQGIISPSISPYNAPLWVVPKKLDKSNEQKWRLVIDYRKLNDETIDDKFPIPNIEEIFDKLGRCQYFSTLDLAKGFYQIEVHPDDRSKTAFSTSNGHYEFNRMPFGLKNAPSTFQRLMNYILREYINKICVVYMDDILIFSTSFDEHVSSLNRIFETLRRANLKIQIDKCDFAQNSTKFLGHIIEKGQIKPDPVKIETIYKWPLPKTQKEIKSFLGITGYYRKFIKDYAKIASPMIEFLKKNKKVLVNDKLYQKSFENLKLLITSEPVLQNPDFGKQFLLTTDASQNAIGAVLSQSNHPVCFASRTLNEHEKRYSTIEKELLAIVWAIKYFRIYLYGRKFSVQTDHKPLVWLNNLKEPNMKLQRWKIKLNEYDFDINYVRGKDNQVADGLSRPPEIFSSHIIQKSSKDVPSTSSGATCHSSPEDDILYIPITEKPINLYKNQYFISYAKKTRIVKNKIFNNNITQVYIAKKTNLVDLMKKFILDKGTMCIFCRNTNLFIKIQDCYVNYFAHNKKLKIVQSTNKLENVSDENKVLNIIEAQHLKLNHRGINETFNELKTKIYTPNLNQKIHKFINNCDICNIAKHDRSPIKTPLKITNMPSNFNDIIHIDIWFPSRNIMYVTMIDKFSKHATLYKIENRNWIAILDCLKRRIMDFGPMKEIVFDNDSCILHNLVIQFLKENNIKHHTTTAGIKTGNSDIERLHGTLNEHLRILECDKNNKFESLDDKIFYIITIYNQTIHSTTKFKPIDFITKNLTKEEITNFANNYQEQKTKRINKINQNRKENERTNNIVQNRGITKNRPKYKRLISYSKNNDYTIDTSNKRLTKYYVSQRKRQFKFQNQNT